VVKPTAAGLPQTCPAPRNPIPCTRLEARSGSKYRQNLGSSKERIGTAPTPHANESPGANSSGRRCTSRSNANRGTQPSAATSRAETSHYGKAIDRARFHRRRNNVTNPQFELRQFREMPSLACISLRSVSATAQPEFLTQKLPSTDPRRGGPHRSDARFVFTHWPVANESDPQKNNPPLR